MVCEFGRAHLCARTRRMSRPGLLLAAVCALALAACIRTTVRRALAGQPRGASVAFESIDGPPPGQFHELVQDLNDEAQTRQLAVMSRESPSAYRVRGYLAAKVVKRETTISWVWDVFDGDEHRALRITGEETAKVRHRDAWAAADDAMLHRIARSSMDQLAAFLTSPDVAPGTPDRGPNGARRQRRFHARSGRHLPHLPAHADPAATTPPPPRCPAGPVPLPPPRPTEAAAIRPAKRGRRWPRAIDQRPRSPVKKLARQ